jgi:hypothetical protein
MSRDAAEEIQNEILEQEELSSLAVPFLRLFLYDFPIHTASFSNTP